MPNYKTKGSFSDEIQPGWTVEDDGFGLLTSRVTFISDGNRGRANVAKKDAHPFDSRLQCHRVSFTVNSASRTVTTAEYVGISGGSETEADVKVDYSAGSQPIQTHPKFANGPAYNEAEHELKFYGWTGTKFDEEDLLAKTAGLVGIKSYVVGEMSVSATFYTTALNTVTTFMNGVGKTIEDLPSGGKLSMPSGTPISANHDRMLLVTGCSYETFAHLFKVSVLIRVATGGWHKYIYERG